MVRIEASQELNTIKWHVSGSAGGCAFVNSQCEHESIGHVSFEGFTRQNPNYDMVIGGRGFTQQSRARTISHTFEGTAFAKTD